jgi:hypothetical protein
MSSAMQEPHDLAQFWNSDLIFLQLPDSHRADMTGIDPKSTALIRTNLEDGQLLIALNTDQPRKLVAVAVSPQLVGRIDLSKLDQPDEEAHPDCWDKPTTAGVLGCVLEGFMQKYVSNRAPATSGGERGDFATVVRAAMEKLEHGDIEAAKVLLRPVSAPDSAPRPIRGS